VSDFYLPSLPLSCSKTPFVDPTGGSGGRSYFRSPVFQLFKGARGRGVERGVDTMRKAKTEREVSDMVNKLKLQ